MVQVVLFAFGEGVSAEFASLASEVVAPRYFGFQAIGEKCILDNRELLSHIIKVFVGDEREVDVAQVVVNGSTTRATPHQMTAFVKQELHVALRIGVLVVADDHRLLVFPKVHGDGVCFLMVREVLLHGAVEEGIVLVADDDL